MLESEDYVGPTMARSLSHVFVRFVFVVPASQPLPRTAGGINSGFTCWSGLMVARAGGHSALVAPKVFWELSMPIDDDDDDDDD